MVDFTKSTRNVLFALLLLGSVAGMASASTSIAAGIHIGPSGHTSVDLGFFYDNLAPYGNWVERPSYGWVWTPTAVATSWHPYEYGHWVWTDEGWVWVSDEPYGWATYHYGRWYDDPEIGWAWVPGDEWGPAWVSWQEGADYVGWAPLPPGVSVSVGFGGGYGGYAYGIAPASYVFVPERDFLAPRIATYAVPYARVNTFWGRTRNFTNYRFGGGRVFNQGVPVDRIQRFAGRVPRYQVADLGGTDFRRFRGGARIQGDRLAIFRPQVQKAARVAPPIQRAAARRAVVSAAQFKAAHPQRVAFAQRQQTLAHQSRQQQVRQQRAEMRGGAPGVNPRGKALQQRQAQAVRQQEKLQQRQTRVDQRQARIDNQRVRANQAQQRQAQSFRQQQKVQQRQARVDQRQARVDRQRVQIDRAQQRQAQAFRQQQRAAAQQQRQARAQRQQFQAGRQQQRFQQAQQRQAMQQQRAAQRQGGGGGRAQGGRVQAQGGNGGHRGHNRPPGQ